MTAEHIFYLALAVASGTACVSIVYASRIIADVLHIKELEAARLKHLIEAAKAREQAARDFFAAKAKAVEQKIREVL